MKMCRNCNSEITKLACNKAKKETDDDKFNQNGLLSLVILNK